MSSAWWVAPSMAAALLVACGPTESKDTLQDEAGAVPARAALRAPAPDLGTPDLRQLQDRLETLSARLDRIEVELQRVGASLDGVAELLRQDLRPDGAEAHRRAGPAEPSRDVRRDAPASRRSLPRLEELAAWDTSDDVRRSWLFASARSVLEELGAPDSVEARDAYEEWSYYVHSDVHGTRAWELTFLSGRLVDCDPPDEK